MKANRLVPIVLALSVAACATPGPAPPSAPAPPAMRPAPLPASPPSADWRDLPQSVGDWRWSVTEARSSAMFGPVGAAQLTLTCDSAARSLTLIRTGTAAGPASLAITATARRRVLVALPTTTGIAVTIPARDGILDAMAFSRGRFMVETPGLPALLVPSWPEISRVVEDCRG